MKRVLIIPLMTTNVNATEFQYTDSYLNCVYALHKMKLLSFDKIVFVIDMKIDAYFNLSSKIYADFTRLHYNGGVEIFIPNKSTKSMAETVYVTIKNLMSEYESSEKLSIFIKDGDNYISLADVPTGNYVTSASLEKLGLVDPVHKSYLNVDEQGFITNAIEKRVISDRFIAGGYSFESAVDYITAYDALNELNNGEKFYVSDIIYWLILNRNVKFMPLDVEEFVDLNIK